MLELSLAQFIPSLSFIVILYLIRYNDMSPLENHHCAVSFKILSSPECNIFSNLSEEEFKDIRGVRTNL